MSDSQAADKALRNNGVGWLRFGPAILSSARRIEFRSHDASDQVSTSKLANFPKVRSWLEENIGQTLNLSPTNPSYKALMPAYYLNVYCTDDGGRENLLAFVPVTPQVLQMNTGFNSKEFQDKLSELRKLMESK